MNGDDEMMSLKMVTWDGDLTQFLVEAETRDEAISKAITANKEFDRFCGWSSADDDLVYRDFEDRDMYIVDDIDFNLLCEIIERNDWFKGKFGEAKVFND